MDPGPSPRRPRVAALLALLCHGLGHLYAGRLGAAAVVHGVSLAILLALLVAMGRGPGPALAAVALALAFWGAQAMHAARVARTAEVPRRWLSGPVGLVLFYAATVVAGAAARLPLGRALPHAFTIPSHAMSPALRPGEAFFVVGAGAVERGDVVVHTLPDAPPGLPQSREPMAKRVVAIGGDTVEVRDGWLVLNGAPVARERVERPCTVERQGIDGRLSESPCSRFVERLGAHAYETTCTPWMPCGDLEAQVVPPRHVFVLGDYRDHSADSRVYGPVREDAILGRVAWVYWSSGPSGPRWDRLGAVVR